jgi:hypothetical protein
MTITTSARPRVRSTFGDLLEEALEFRGLSIRAFSRLWAESHGGKPESRRRLLHKYIDEGVMPGPESRIEIAHLLALPTNHFDGDAQERRAKQEVADALAPLVDVLYRLAVEAAQKGKQ